MRQIFYSFVILSALVLGMQGCGDDNSDAGHPEFTHDRDLRQNDFDANVLVWEFDNQEGLKIHQTQTDLYLQFTHNSDLPNIQFFLDIDNNPKTGVPIELGADYMVENGYLYVAVDTAWGWKEVRKVQSVVEAGIRDTVKVPLSQFSNKSAVFKAFSESLDSEWNPKIFSPRNVDIKSTYDK